MEIAIKHVKNAQKKVQKKNIIVMNAKMGILW